MGTPGLNCRNWEGVSLDERQAYFDARYIAHPQAARFIDQVVERVHDKQTTGFAKGIRGIAPPGGGKSAMLRCLESRWPRLDEEERSTVTVVGFSVPSPCTPNSFAKTVLAVLDGPRRDSRDTRTPIEWAILQMQKAGTLLVIVDNTQDIPERRGEKGIAVVGNILRDFADKFVLVLLGTEQAEIVVKSNKQLARRVSGMLPLCSYDITIPAGLSMFLRIINEFERALPLCNQSGIATSRLGKALAFASDGRPGFVHDHLSLAMKYAVNDRRESINGGDLRRAYAYLFLDSANIIDPFEDGFKEWRRLDRPGEPHHDERVRAREARHGPQYVREDR